MSILKNEIKILKFEAEWCKPCKAMNPVINQLKAENKDIIVESIDVSKPENEKLRAKYDIRSYPTFLFFHNELIMDTIVGTCTLSEIKKTIKRLL